MAYTPGTKMPEQTIGSPQDRAALMQFLEKATRRSERWLQLASRSKSDIPP